MQNINGSTQGGEPIHSDNPAMVGYVTKGSDGQGNGRVPMTVTSHMIGDGKAMEGERGIGDISKDKFGSMNGKPAGEMRGEGGKEGLYGNKR